MEKKGCGGLWQRGQLSYRRKMIREMAKKRLNTKTYSGGRIYSIWQLSNRKGERESSAFLGFWLEQLDGIFSQQDRDRKRNWLEEGKGGRRDV